MALAYTSVTAASARDVEVGAVTKSSIFQPIFFSATRSRFQELKLAPYWRSICAEWNETGPSSVLTLVPELRHAEISQFNEQQTYRMALIRIVGLRRVTEHFNTHKINKFNFMLTSPLLTK